MKILSTRQFIQASALALLLCAAGAATHAQTPTSTPPVSPAQRDATRPPGQEQNQIVPPEARPQTQDPTAPPGVERTAPQAPPGTNVTPGTPTNVQPLTPTQTTPLTQTEPGTQQTPLQQEPREPRIPLDQQQARPVPPMPNLTRLGVTSDNTVTLTLNEAIRRALENNNDIEIARDDVRFAETQLRSLQGFYEPIFSVTPQIDKRTTPQQSLFAGATSAGTTSNTTYSLNPAVTKFFNTGGGRYDLTFTNSKSSTNSTADFFNPAYSSNLSLTFTQPLLRDRSIDNTRRQIRIQRKRLEQSDADFRRRTIDVIQQVQRSYWDLVFALRDQQIQIDNLNLTRENLRRVEAQIAAGASAPLARAEVQTELANRESSLLVSAQNVSIAENNLKQLILKDPQSRDWSAQLTPTDTPAFDATPVNLNDALAEATKNRPELRRLTLQRDINSIDLQYFKNQDRPRVDIQATVATTGLAGTPIPRFDKDGKPILPPANLIGGFGKDISNLLNFQTRNIIVGVAIQFPFHNKTAEADLAGARIQRSQLEASTRLQEQSIEVEVRNSAQAVETARRRVLTARAARENAELQLSGEQRLYQVGRSTTFLLFQRENALANARNAELRAETDYNKAIADLQRATSTTLRANNVIVETPTVP